MKTTGRLSLLLLLVTLFSSATITPEKPAKIFISDYENVLGTSMEIKIIAGEEQNAGKAENAALAEIDRLNKILSGYDPSSEFSQWKTTTNTAQPVSSELFEVLSLFEQWRSKTQGALDASAEAIGKLWKTTARENRTPSEQEIKEVLNAIRQQHYELDANKQTATHKTDAALMLNSFAKSYILQKAADAALKVPGVQGVVVNIGGDILVRGEHTEQVMIANPKADAENDLPISQIQVANKTVATSGNYRRGVFIEGKWYSHIVDPRTGYPASQVISATVIADNATDAGALATALNVLSPKEGEELVASIPGAEYMLITADGKRIKSDGWDEINPAATVEPANTRSVTAAAKDWDTKYELAINLELATIEGTRIRRPFVAVWVTDADKKPVRLLALWFNKPKWLNDMRSWYATYYGQFSSGPNNISSTSSATRTPGKYTLKWDGKDDNGNLVKQGTYTVFIEAAREHGTYQIMRQEIKIGKKQHIDIAGNPEVSSASLDYQKKSNGN
ncbi:MAG TPA: DUF2271 domain-containing protein [Chitinophagaceae bacterium]|nr:DUF2271 domain-containing protein [Chitinophagaceae bacterium]